MIKKTLITLLLFLICFTVKAINIPEPTSSVMDIAEIFSNIEKQNIINEIEKVQNETSVEITVLTVKTTEWQDISQLATEIAHKWWVGKNDVDNGIFILIASEDRKWFIATGYGVEWAIPDITAMNIGKNRFPVNFRNNKYATGIILAIQDMHKILQGDESVISQYKNVKTTNNKAMKNKLFLTIMFLLILKMFRKNLIKKNKKYKILIYILYYIILWFLLYILFIEMFLRIIAFIFIIFAEIPRWKGGMHYWYWMWWLNSGFWGGWFWGFWGGWFWGGWGGWGW